MGGTEVLRNVVEWVKRLLSGCLLLLKYIYDMEIAVNVVVSFITFYPNLFVLFSTILYMVVYFYFGLIL